jgi:hypothetical protein
VEHASFEASRHWAQAVAATAASSGAQAMALKDYAQLETTLRDIARLPGVLKIDVVEAGGAPLLSIRNQQQGELIIRYRPTDMQAPIVPSGGGWSCTCTQSSERGRAPGAAGVDAG